MTRFLLPFLGVAGLAACSSVSLPSLPSLPSVELPRSPLRPYTIDVQQGVVVDQAMVDKLKPGMTRNQVGLVLGTPLLADVMHAERWDYVFYTRHDNEVGQWRRFTVIFKEDRLSAIVGDVTLGTGEAAAGAAVAPPDTSSGLPAPLPEAPK